MSSYDWGTYLTNRDRPDAMLNLLASRVDSAPTGNGGLTVPQAPKRTVVRGGDGGIVSWARRQLGTKEGSRRQRYYAKRLGVGADLPWCSIFVANALKSNGVRNLPSNPAYSGAWMNWKGGRRVSKRSVRPGDIVIFDWGDGGITDHVAIYEGRGRVIGGNQSNAVTRAPARLGQAVAVIRPR